MLRCVLHSCVRPVNLCSCVLLFYDAATPHAEGCPHVLRHAHAATHGQTRLAFWGGGAVSRNTWIPMCQCRTLLQKFSFMAAIAQLGERQTEDLKAPGSIPGLGIPYQSWGLSATVCSERQTSAPCGLPGARLGRHVSASD